MKRANHRDHRDLIKLEYLNSVTSRIANIMVSLPTAESVYQRIWDKKMFGHFFIPNPLVKMSFTHFLFFKKTDSAVGVHRVFYPLYASSVVSVVKNLVMVA